MDSNAINIGCSGWFYWHWRSVVYPADIPTSRWFAHYQQHLATVELNAPFYRWPKPATVQNWRRNAVPGFKYSVKVNQEITHERRFRNTKLMVREFCKIADVLGEHMGCFLFQLPPSFHHSPARLRAICDQLDPTRRCAVEFRHRSWWNDTVFAAFRKAGLIFCSVSAPRLPDQLITSADTIYLRMHGVKRWYRYDYSDEELAAWAGRLKAAAARETWCYFNNDFQGCAFRNALRLKKLVGSFKATTR